jgi:NTE family protein
VLSGGGARGAYQVGIVAGILDVLGEKRFPQAVFNVLCGTSVGAINASYFASHADKPDLGIAGLVEAWRSLKLSTHLRLDLKGFLGFTGSSEVVPEAGPESSRPIPARALVDTAPLSDLVRRSVAFTRLHDNIDQGVVRALVLTALEIGSGRTTMFVDAGRGVEFPPTNDPRRNVRRERIGLEHVLASSALPILFPPRRIHGEAYCDGGIRFNTPIAPAIRAGADRLVVVSLLSESPSGEDPNIPVEVREASFKSPAFILGKVLNALLLDPMHYDLQVLERFNQMLDEFERVLTPEQLASFHRVVRSDRNMAYRKLRTLVFRPTHDIGALGVEYARNIRPDGFGARLLHRMAAQRAVWQSDLVSFLCFDGGFADELVSLGRREARSRADDIIAFFGD